MVAARSLCRLRDHGNLRPDVAGLLDYKMRINVYSQELTPEVVKVTKESNTGIVYKAVQFVLHSSPMLHHPPQDDDRSAVTFWLPQSDRGLREFHTALAKAYMLVGDELAKFDSPVDGEVNG
jgi:hypothetical protein